MSDETFKQRKSISPSEVNPLQESTNVQNAAALEVGSEPAARPDPGIEIKGNIPEAFRQAMGQQQHQNQPQSHTPQQPMRLAGSSKLEELVAGIYATTHHYHEITLPSLGKFYNGDGPSDGILHIRSMTGDEEQILATPRLVRKGQAINMIFDRCIQEDYRSERFLTPDRTFLLIFLRGLSYTKDYDVEVRCSECSAKFATLIDLDTLWVDKCPEDFNSDSLIGKLPTTGYSYSYKLSTGVDEQHIQDYRDRKIKAGFDTSGQSDDTLLYRTAMLLEDIEGITSKSELQVLLKRLPINDVAHLRNAVNNQPFGVDTNVPIACPVCYNDFSVDLPLEANFFFPRARKETQDRQV